MGDWKNFDQNIRRGKVQYIAHTLREIDPSQNLHFHLDLAQKLENLCFNNGRSFDDYENRINKRLAKARMAQGPVSNAHAQNFSQQSYPHQHNGYYGSQQQPGYSGSQNHQSNIHGAQCHQNLPPSGPQSHSQYQSYQAQSQTQGRMNGTNYANSMPSSSASGQQNYDPSAVNSLQGNAPPRAQRLHSADIPDPIPVVRNMSHGSASLDDIPDPIPLSQHPRAARSSYGQQQPTSSYDNSGYGNQQTGATLGGSFDPEAVRRRQTVLNMEQQHGAALKSFKTKSLVFFRNMQQKPRDQQIERQLAKLKQYIMYVENTLKYMEKVNNGHYPSAQTLQGLDITIKKILSANTTIEGAIKRQQEAKKNASGGQGAALPPRHQQGYIQNPSTSSGHQSQWSSGGMPEQQQSVYSSLDNSEVIVSDAQWQSDSQQPTHSPPPKQPPSKVNSSLGHKGGVDSAAAGPAAKAPMGQKGNGVYPSQPGPPPARVSRPPSATMAGPPADEDPMAAFANFDVGHGEESATASGGGGGVPADFGLRTISPDAAAAAAAKAQDAQPEPAAPAAAGSGTTVKRVDVTLQTGGVGDPAVPEGGKPKLVGVEGRAAVFQSGVLAPSAENAAGGGAAPFRKPSPLASLRDREVSEDSNDGGGEGGGGVRIFTPGAPGGPGRIRKAQDILSSQEQGLASPRSAQLLDRRPASSLSEGERLKRQRLLPTLPPAAPFPKLSLGFGEDDDDGPGWELCPRNYSGAHYGDSLEQLVALMRQHFPKQEVAPSLAGDALVMTCHGTLEVRLAFEPEPPPAEQLPPAGRRPGLGRPVAVLLLRAGEEEGAAAEEEGGGLLMARLRGGGAAAGAGAGAGPPARSRFAHHRRLTAAAAAALRACLRAAPDHGGLRRFLEWAAAAAGGPAGGPGGGAGRPAVGAGAALLRARWDVEAGTLVAPGLWTAAGEAVAPESVVPAPPFAPF